MELKARYPDLERAARIVESLGGEYSDTLTQVDTYFHSVEGRLKMRRITSHQSRETETQLIWYRRPNEGGIRGSDYLISPVPEGTSCREALDRGVGIVAEVSKTRDLYFWESVRIHLDRVDGVGRFIEFEAGVHVEEGDEVSRKRLETLCHHLQISSGDYVPQSYVELLKAQ